MGGQRGAFLRREGALPHGELEISAEDLAALVGQPLCDGAGQCANGGQRADPQKQADQQ